MSKEELKAYDKKEDAERAHFIQLTDPQWFCPLINDICNPDCVCHDTGKVYKFAVRNKPQWSFTKQKCVNSMFFGNTRAGEQGSE